MDAACTSRAAAATRSSANASSDCDFSTPIFRLPVRALVSWSQHLRPATRRNANNNYAGITVKYACATSCSISERRSSSASNSTSAPFAPGRYGRPKVLLQRLARDGGLNGTLADVSIKDDEVAVSGNYGVGGNSNVHDCSSGGRSISAVDLEVCSPARSGGRTLAQSRFADCGDTLH
jgi:hypothetical protein